MRAHEIQNARFLLRFVNFDETAAADTADDSADTKSLWKVSQCNNMYSLLVVV